MKINRSSIIISTLALGMFFSPQWVFSQNKLENKMATYSFEYRRCDRLLLINYKSNKKNLSLMNSKLAKNKKNLRSGLNHLAIVSYIKPNDLKDPELLINAAIQANVVRSYMKVHHKIDSKCSTFMFDTIHNKTDNVSVEYISKPKSALSNSMIYYSLNNNKSAIRHSLARYKVLPVINEVKNDSTAIKKVDVQANKLTDEPLVVVDSIKEPTPIVPEAVLANEQKYIPKSKFQPFISLKTNLLYWAGVIPTTDYHYSTPNIELECYFAKKWSINLDASYIRVFHKDDNSKIWDVSSIGLESRYWVSPSNKFSGLYGGAYALLGEFDVKQNDQSIDGYTGKFKETGLSLGYCLMLTPRWGVEAGLRYGYRWVDGRSYLYRPQVVGVDREHYDYQYSYAEHKFKITGLRLLISYRLGK